MIDAASLQIISWPFDEEESYSIFTKHEVGSTNPAPYSALGKCDFDIVTFFTPSKSVKIVLRMSTLEAPSSSSSSSLIPAL